MGSPSGGPFHLPLSFECEGHRSSPTLERHAVTPYMICRNGTGCKAMKLHWKIRNGLGAALLLAVFAVPSHSAEVVVPSGAVLQGQIQTMENRIQRQQYQQNQQIMREIDRGAANRQPQNPHVTIMRPGCQRPVFGDADSPPPSCR